MNQQQSQLVSRTVTERDFGRKEFSYPDVRARQWRGDGVVEVGRVLDPERNGRRLEPEKRDERVERPFGLDGDPFGVTPPRRVVEQDPDARGNEFLGSEGWGEEREKGKEKSQLEGRAPSRR